MELIKELPEVFEEFAEQRQKSFMAMKGLKDQGVPVVGAYCTYFPAEIARAMGVEGVDQMSVEEYRKAAVDAVRKLSVDVGIPTKLEAIKEEDLQFLAESAYADACAPGNPKDASVEDLKALFRKIM